MFKKYLSLIIATLVIVVLVGGFIYQRGLFLSSQPVVNTSTSSITDLSAKTLNDAGLQASVYQQKLIKVQTVPLSTDTLQTNPKPLFKASE